jgi:DNA-directed RNA polymerase subunit RPC12/RpoP
MTLGNMRELGARSIIVACTPCGHSGVVNCEPWSDDFPIPDVVLKLRCSGCGSKRLTSIINVAEMYEGRRRD